MSDPLAWLDDALDDLDQRALRRTLEERWSPQSSRIDFAAETLINFGSNDYLGLAYDVAVCGIAQQAIRDEGWGAGASPLVSGRSLAHLELERALARFENTESAIVFPTGFAANVGAISSLVGQGDVIFSDAKNHASIIDGCRLSGATINIYRHCDIDHLRELLTGSQSFRRRLIVTDSIFSMDGDIAPLEAIVDLATSSVSMLLVDEAHATGVFGRLGRGICEHLGVEDRALIRVGTLSKALGGLGGFVAGPQRLIDWLANRARTLIYSTAVPAAVAAAAERALEIVRNEPERREVLRRRADDLRSTLVRHGLSIGQSKSQIIPVVLSEPRRTLAVATELRQMGFFVPAIRPPSVPEGESLLRISLTYLHTEEQIEGLVAALAELTR
jgi:8-amino-7-oxononanoate synthase